VCKERQGNTKRMKKKEQRGTHLLPNPNEVPCPVKAYSYIEEMVEN